MVKRALILAGIDQRYLHIDKSCFSIAFWGAPHYGSTVLSEATYKDSVAEQLGLQYPMGPLLRNEFRADNLENLNEDFAPLASRLKKIWSFTEAKETTMRFKLSESSVGKVDLLVVDRRSATLTRADLRVGCEVVITLPTEHSKLTHFGDDDSAPALLNEYISDLQALVESIAINVEHEVKAAVHFFVEGTKLWSDHPSVHELFQNGPNFCLLRKRRDMQGVLSDKSDEQRVDKPSPSYAVPVIVVNGDADTASVFSEKGLATPSLGSTISKEDDKESETRAQSTDTLYQEIIDDLDRRYRQPPISQADFFAPEELSPLVSNTSGVQSVPSIKISKAWSSTTTTSTNNAKERGNNDVVVADRRNHSKSLFPDQPSKHQQQFETTIFKTDKARLPDLPRPPKFRWIHIPFNVMYWVPQAFRALAEERNKPSLCQSLLQESVWDSMQNVSRHGLPHGRFMRPGCRLLDSNLNRAPTFGSSTTLPGSSNQLQIYVRTEATCQ